MTFIDKVKRRLCRYLGIQNRFMDKYRLLLTNDPLNEELHFQFGRECLKQGNGALAIAEFKTSISLGKMEVDVIDFILEAQEKSPPLISMDHNTYYRFASLQREIKSLVGSGSDYSVLDVGGGEGGLAQFLQTNHYCLVEPDVNGITGIDLPFEDKAFDIVVSCHVLEHIPVEDRSVFLDQLCSKAKHAVILLNPFQVDGVDEKERLMLHIEITDAWWAKEHLEFTLPRLEEVQRFAQQRGMGCCIEPNGSIALSFASVYVDHFASKARQYHDLSKVSQFMNEHFTDIAVAGAYPNAYMVSLVFSEDKS